MALQFTPNPRATGNLSLTVNARARLASIVSVDWDHVTGKTVATQQIITSGSTVDVAVTDSLIIINKTIGSPTTVNIPSSLVKIGQVKIVDWKGDAGTNPITITLYVGDKFQGNLTSWVLGADGASVKLDPISGVGYGI